MKTRKRKFTHVRPLILSRHPSHKPLRRKYNKDKNFLLPFRSVVRFGSSTETRRFRVELNSVEAIKNSSNKLRMKRCFIQNGVKTAMWWTYSNNTFISGSNGESTTYDRLPYPIVVKAHFGSRGQGNTKIDNAQQMKAWIDACENKSNFIFEVYHNFSKEYRLHVSKYGCFYTCRKMMKKDTPEDDKWFRNDKNCVWITEDSESNMFDRPNSWSDIEDHCIKALKAVGLDFGAVDLRVQKNNDDRPSDFIVIEINSAPSFGELTLEKYKEVIPKLLRSKAREQNINRI